MGGCETTTEWVLGFWVCPNNDPKILQPVWVVGFWVFGQKPKKTMGRNASPGGDSPIYYFLLLVATIVLYRYGQPLILVLPHLRAAVA